MARSRGKSWYAVDVPDWLLLSGEMALAEQVRKEAVMPVDPDLLELYVDTVQIAPYQSTDFDNVDTFGANVPYRAKIDAKTEEVLRRSGDVAVSTHSVALDDVYSIDERDRITMPATPRFRIANPEIKAVWGWSDEMGDHHTTVKVGARKGASA